MKMFIVIFILSISIIIILPLANYVWPLDIFDKEPQIIAETKSTSGERFYLTQLWVGDGYLTKLRHITGKGRGYDYVLDPDGNKIWSGSLALISSNVMEVAYGGKTSRYDFHARRYTNWNGQIIASHEW